MIVSRIRENIFVCEEKILYLSVQKNMFSIFTLFLISSVSALNYGPFTSIPDVCASVDMVQIEHEIINGTDTTIYSSRRNGIPDTYLCVTEHSYGGPNIIEFDPIGKVMNDGNFYEFFAVEGDELNPEIYMKPGRLLEPTLIFPGFTTTGPLSVTLCSFSDTRRVFNCFAFFGFYSSISSPYPSLYFALTNTISELTTYSPYTIIPGATSTLPPVLAWATDSNIVAIVYQQEEVGNLMVYWTNDGNEWTQVTNFPSSSLNVIVNNIGFAYFPCSTQWSFLLNVGGDTPLVSITSANSDITSGVWSINTEIEATSSPQQSISLYAYNPPNCYNGQSGTYTYINYNTHNIIQGNVHI